MERFDLIVIGGGPGGYTAAQRAGESGLRVALFEKRELGGVCLNEGCVPTKTFLNSAKVLAYASHAKDYGVTVSGEVGVNQTAVVARKNTVVRKLVAGVKFAMRNAGVTVIREVARFTSRDTDGIHVATDTAEYVSEHVIIATGSAPVIPPITGLNDGLERGYVVTNRELLDMTSVPQDMVIIGGGVIGLEMAAYYTTIGSKVTVVEMLPKIAGALDTEVTAVLQRSLEKRGTKFILGAKVTQVAENAVFYEKDGTGASILCDLVLLSIGRRANIAELCTECVGITIERGRVVTDKYMSTNVQGIYAVGDVNGVSMLAHTAYREAEVAVNHILGGTDEMHYDNIPAVIYTTPEVATVGLTAESADARGIDTQVVKLPLTYSGRYVAENTEVTGIAKLVFDRTTSRLVGAHIVGTYSGEYITTLTSYIDLSVSLDDIKKIVFPHPTVSEIIREGVFAYKPLV